MASLEIGRDIFAYTSCDAYIVGCDGTPNQQCLVWQKNINDWFLIYALYRLGVCSYIPSADIVWSKYNHNTHKWEEVWRRSFGGYYGYCWYSLNWVWDMALYKVEYQGLTATFRVCPYVPTTITISVDKPLNIGSKVVFSGTLAEQSTYWSFSVYNQHVLIGYMSGATFNKIAEGYTDVNGNYSIPWTVNLPVGTYDFKAFFDGEMISGIYDTDIPLWYTLLASEALFTLPVSPALPIPTSLTVNSPDNVLKNQTFQVWGQLKYKQNGTWAGLGGKIIYLIYVIIPSVLDFILTSTDFHWVALNDPSKVASETTDWWTNNCIGAACTRATIDIRIPEILGSLNPVASIRWKSNDWHYIGIDKSRDGINYEYLWGRAAHYTFDETIKVNLDPNCQYYRLYFGDGNLSGETTSIGKNIHVENLVAMERNIGTTTTLSDGTYSKSDSIIPETGNFTLKSEYKGD